MKHIYPLIIFAAVALMADAMSVDEARDNLKAARRAYMDALTEAGITNRGDRARAWKRDYVTVNETKAANVLTKSQKAFFENRRICVGRDTVTLPGYVITTWHRNGKPDTKAPAVVTNALHNIVGREQANPLQTLAEQLRADAENLRANAEQWKAAATNATARVERVTAALDERRAEYVQKRDAAALPTTKAIYQAFVDAIGRIKAKIEED